MASMQILDANGVAIPLRKLDEEAASFWGVELHDKYYASPKESSLDWFHTIGQTIAYSKNHDNLTWDSVAFNMATEDLAYHLFSGTTFKKSSIKDVSDREFFGITVDTLRDHWQPYLDLITYWKEKGYQPCKI